MNNNFLMNSIRGLAKSKEDGIKDFQAAIDSTKK